MTYLTFSINQTEVKIPPYSELLDLNLLQYLRKSGLSGCKQVCGEGGCGACTVIISHWDSNQIVCRHRSVTACLVPLPFLHQSHITTIEGLSQLANGATHPVCDAFYKMGASQCGFCTPGFIMSFFAQLQNRKKIYKTDLENIFDGNLCRCTGYRPILDAASMFCQDPVEDPTLKIQGTRWAEDFAKTKSLDDIFPHAYKKADLAFKIQGEKTTWIRPVNTVELFKSFQVGDQKTKLSAGNTDLGVQETKYFWNYNQQISLQGISKMHQIKWTEYGVVIGGGVNIAQLENELSEKLPSIPVDKATHLVALHRLCRFFANNQIRNMATIGGGIMNFSNYSDLIPFWVASRSTLNFERDHSKKSIVLADHFSSDGDLQFSPDHHEILMSVSVPFANASELNCSFKYSRRRLDAITFLSASVSCQMSPDNSIQDIILCFDGLGKPGLRAMATEKIIRNQIWNAETQHQALKTLSLELKGKISNHLPPHLQNYQLRLAQGVLLRSYSMMREKFFHEENLRDLRLVSRYPQVAHRTQVEFSHPGHGILGEPIPHRYALFQTTGVALFTADRQVANCLFAHLITSPIAEGRLINIDSSAIANYPELVGVFTAKDIPGKNLFGFRVEDQEFLASSKVHYVGQPVAILVAKSEAHARELAQKVRVLVKEELALLAFDEAIAARSTHGKSEGYFVKQGDTEKAFGKSFKIVEQEVSIAGQNHMYLEANNALVIPKDDGYLVFSSTQSPSNVVENIATLLGITENHIDVQVGRIGGGFGGKQLRAGPIAALAALAAYVTKLPVKLNLTRSQDMQYCPGRSPARANYKAGFAENGKLLSLEVNFYLSGGHGRDYSADIAETATLLMDSCYRVENVNVRGTCLKTNYGSTTSTRGFGKPKASAIIESALDHGAAVLGLDSTMLRRVNLYRQGDLTITKAKISDDVMALCWDHLVQKTNYENLKKEVDQFNQQNRWIKRGIAVLGSKGNMGFVETDDINRGLALVSIQKDATVTLNHSGVEMGQGINTRLAQVAAQALGVSFDQVTVNDTSSSIIPNTPPTTMVATDLIGQAILNACDQLKKTLQKFSGTFLEQVQQAYHEGLSLTESGIYTEARLAYDYEKQQGDISYMFVWGAGLTIAEVDVISGSFRLLKSSIVQDCGRSLNPHLDIGQAEGGFMFGVGMYLLEEMIYSPEGKLITDNVSGYKIPTAGDLPLEWDIELLNYEPNLKSLHSSKGIGESNVQLGLSAYFAVKEAIRAARIEAGLSREFRLDFPASVDRVARCLPSLV